MNSPLENPDQSTPPNPMAGPDKGSLLIGFLVGWAAMIGSVMVGGVLLAIAGGLLSGWDSAFSLIAVVTGLLPMASLIGLIVFYASKGKSRSALGVLAAFGSLVALCLLLVAACFGLLSGTNLGR